MERIWASRLRWRLRGAWMWPAFAVLTVLNGLLLHARPIAGEKIGLFEAILVAAFFNLVTVAVFAPIAGALLRRRRRDLPKVVAADYAGAAQLVAVSVVLAVGGALHRPAVLEQRRDFHAQAAAVRSYVLAQAPAEYRANLDRADTRQIDAHMYRTCVPGADPDRSLCLFVSTDQSPPGLRLDPNRETNQSFSGRESGLP